METGLYEPPLGRPRLITAGGGEGKAHLNIESFTGIGGLGRGPGTVPALGVQLTRLVLSRTRRHFSFFVWK